MYSCNTLTVFLQSLQCTFVHFLSEYVFAILAKYFHTSHFEPSNGMISSTILTPSLTKSLACVIIILIFSDVQGCKVLFDGDCNS